MKRVDSKLRPGFLIPIMILESAGCLVGAWAVPVMEAKLLFFFNVRIPTKSATYSDLKSGQRSDFKAVHYSGRFRPVG